MLPSDEALKALHKKSIRNEEEILRFKSCCCFECVNFFASTDIVEWLDEGDQKTAMCPRCGFDTVLPNDPNSPISEALLKEMQTVYIGSADNENQVISSFSEVFHTQTDKKNDQAQ